MNTVKGRALVVRYECRDGNLRMWISPIVRTKGGVALADTLEMGEQAVGAVRQPVLTATPSVQPPDRSVEHGGVYSLHLWNAFHQQTGRVLGGSNRGVVGF